MNITNLNELRPIISNVNFAIQQEFGKIEKFSDKGFFLRNLFQNAVLLLLNHMSKTGVASEEKRQILTEYIDQVLNEIG